MNSLYLGIDIGTSGCKMALYDAMGKPHASVTEPYDTLRPAPGHAEQNAKQWWLAVCRGLPRLWEQGPSPKNVAAVGVDGQGWAAVPLDGAGNVLANTPIWMDTRAAHTCAQWGERLSRERIFAVSGNPFSPTYTLPKVLHWMEHAPELVESSAHILQSSSFIVYRLTGDISMDYSMSYGWHNFNQATLEYDADLTKAFRLPERFLINPVPSHAIVGHVTARAALSTGLVQGTPVVAGGLDAACGTLGAGVVQSGQTQEQGGQAGGMSICVDKPLSHPALILGAHVVPGKWLLQGGTVGGGASLKWFAEQIAMKGGLDSADDSIFAKLSQSAASSPPGAGGLLFLPYLAGERSPIWDAKAQGMYFGISYSTVYGDFVRATMEGAAFALRHNIETAKEAGACISGLHATGGSANSHIWAQIKADITGLPMHIPNSDGATTCGAAMLAMVGVGRYGGFDEAVSNIVRIKRSHTPNDRLYPAYTALFDIYKALYKATSAQMKGLFALQHSGESTMKESRC